MAQSIWLKEHADLEKYGNELLYKVNIRNQQGKSGIQFSRVSNGLITELPPIFLYSSDNFIIQLINWIVFPCLFLD